MTLSLKEFTTLKALMARTTSDADPEALAAIRAANRILAAHKLTWAAVFARTVTVVSEITGEMINLRENDDNYRLDDKTIDAALEAALDSTSGTFREMLLDIQAKHERGIRLSEKQIAVVIGAADRSLGRRR